MNTKPANEQTESSQPFHNPYADSGSVDFDISPEAIERRLKTVGQLNRLTRYLSKGIVLGPVNDKAVGDHLNE